MSDENIINEETFKDEKNPFRFYNTPTLIGLLRNKMCIDNKLLQQLICESLARLLEGRRE